MGRKIEGKQIKAIWAAAREHGLHEDIVRDIVQAVSGQDSIRALSYLDAAKVIGRIKGYGLGDKDQKRTDVGGDPSTVPLRRKIYRLCGELGWNNDNNRINGFCKRMTGVERIEWLSVLQCHHIIEALKKMLER